MNTQFNVGDLVSTTVYIPNLNTGRFLKEGTKVNIEFQDKTDGLFFCRTLNHKGSFWAASCHLERSI